MPIKTVQVAAAVSDHWLRGKLTITMGRAQETLNDHTTQYLDLSDVEIRSWCGQSYEATRPKLTVVKESIEFIIVQTDDHESPDKRWDNFVAKPVHSGFAMAGSTCIWGDLQLANRSADVRLTLLHQLPHFFALTSASIAGPKVQQSDIPLLFVNRHWLRCLDLGDLAEKKLSAEETITGQLAQIARDVRVGSESSLGAGSVFTGVGTAR